MLVDSTIFVVADGMGGHKAGEVASALTVQLLKRRLEPTSTAISLDDVLAAVVEANNEIFEAATSNVDHQGMGTTLTGLFVVRPPAPTDAEGDGAAPPLPDQFALINVGDSRTYLLRHGRLRRVTVDHNYVQELVNTGHITDDEARTHPRRNIVTRALGIDPSVRVDAWTLPIVRGDRFVVCSDGLSDEVHDTEIHQILTTVGDPQAAAEELAAAANRHGGRDNVSVIVVDVVDGADPPAADEELDIEPVWQPAPAAGTWAVADPTSTEPETFEDLAALASAQGVRVITPSGGTRVITAEVPITPAPRKKRRVAGFLLSVLALAILVTVFVIIAAYAAQHVPGDVRRRRPRRHLPRPRLPVVPADARGDLPVQPRPARRELGRARRAPVRLHQRRRRRGLPQRPHPDDDHDDDDDHDHHHHDDVDHDDDRAACRAPHGHRPRRHARRRGSSGHDGAGRTPRSGPPLHRTVAGGDGRDDHRDRLHVRVARPIHADAGADHPVPAHPARLAAVRPSRRALVRPRCRSHALAARRPAPRHRLRHDHPPRSGPARRIADDVEHHRHRRLRPDAGRRAAGTRPRPLSLDVPLARRRPARHAARARRRPHVRRRPHLGEHRPGQLPARRVRQARPRHLLRQLSRRQSPADRRRHVEGRPVPPPRAARPAPSAGGMGVRRAGDGRRARPRVVAAVLHPVRRHAVGVDRARRLPVPRRGDVLRRRLRVVAGCSATSSRASTSGSTRGRIGKTTASRSCRRCGACPTAG